MRTSENAPQATMSEGLCRHCGLPRTGYASVDGQIVCHTATVGLPDCYRRVTVHGEPLGALLDANPVPSGIHEIRNAQIRTMHQYGYRCGEWATLVSRLHVRGRECYLVRFDDGSSDFWVTDDPAGLYEFRVTLASSGGEIR